MITKGKKQKRNRKGDGHGVHNTLYIEYNGPNGRWRHTERASVERRHTGPLFLQSVGRTRSKMFYFLFCFFLIFFCFFFGQRSLAGSCCCCWWYISSFRRQQNDEDDQAIQSQLATNTYANNWWDAGQQLQQFNRHKHARQIYLG